MPLKEILTMRLPRVRFTIGRLMMVVLIVGTSLWVYVEYRARVAYLNARLTRELAEFALKEFDEGIYLQDRATSTGRLSLVQSDLERARERKEIDSILSFIDKAQAKFDFEQAKTQLDILMKPTRGKARQRLVNDVEKARANEQAKLKASQTARLNQWWSGTAK